MTTDFAGWTPIRVRWDGGAGLVDWCCTDGVEFDDPFFTQTVERCLHHPARLLFRRETPLERLPELGGAAPQRPAGLVFHASRSGSTLVAQMFAARGDTRVISEAGPVDDVVRAPAPPAARVEWLRALVSLLGAGARPHLVLKLDAWSALDLPLLRAAFPDVPWVFVYRDPVEILVSQRARPGYHMLPFALPPAAVGLSAAEAAEAAGAGQASYAAAVLAAIVAAVAEEVTAGSPALLVNHSELPAAGPRIAEHFGIPTDGTARSAMLAAARRDAKNPVLEYADDRERKQREADEELRAAAERVAPGYAVLERLRRERLGQ